MEVKFLYTAAGRTDLNRAARRVDDAIQEYLCLVISEMSGVSGCDLEIKVEFTGNTPAGPEFGVKVSFKGPGVIETTKLRARATSTGVLLGDLKGNLIGPQDLLKELKLQQMV